MDIYSTEEEQADAIKKWLKTNGPAIIIGIVLGLSGLKGWEFWQHQQQQNNATASAEYEAALLQLDSTAIPELEAQFAAFKTRNENIAYNNFLQLKLAQKAVTTADYDVASTALNKVIATPANDAIKHTAVLRLARVLIANDKAADAIVMLNRDAESYQQLYSQIRGDAYLATGEVEKARQAYFMAKDDNTSNNSNLQMKIDNLALTETALSTAIEAVTVDDSEASTDAVESSASDSAQNESGEGGQ